MKINQPTNLKAIQFLTSPFQGKRWAKFKAQKQVEKIRVQKQDELLEVNLRELGNQQPLETK